VHFRKFAPEQIPYAIKRYDFEARRHWQIIDDRLAKGRYMMGETYTILDMAVWGWGNRLTYMLADDNIMEKYPNLDRLMKRSGCTTGWPARQGAALAAHVQGSLR
jgi:GST-like protein